MGLMAKVGKTAAKVGKSLSSELLSRIVGRSFGSGLVFARSPIGEYAKGVGAGKFTPARIKKVRQFGADYGNERLVLLADKWLNAKELENKPASYWQGIYERDIGRELKNMQGRYNLGRATTLGTGTATGGGIAYSNRKKDEE